MRHKKPRKSCEICGRETNAKGDVCPKCKPEWQELESEIEEERVEIGLEANESRLLDEETGWPYDDDRRELSARKRLRLP